MLKEAQSQGNTRPASRAARRLERLLAELIPALAEEVTENVKARLGVVDVADDWVDQRRSPLGARPHCELARSGKLEGARRVGRRWLVRRSVIDRYVETHPGPSKRTEEPAGEDAAAVLAELGLELISGAARKGGSR